jgi:hypothetical protein
MHTRAGVVKWFKVYPQEVSQGGLV